MAKYSTGSGHNNAPTVISPASTYMQIGGREYNTNGKRGIGFGYVSGPGNNAPVWIGYDEKNTSSNSYGDFIIGTRNVTTDTAATPVFRVRWDKQVLMDDAAYVPSTDQSIVTRKYADRGRTGTTAERPAGLLAADAGFQFYDTTLKKPLWWNGTHWTDATGTNV